MVPSRRWLSTKGSIMPCSAAMRRIQWSGMMDMGAAAFGGRGRASPGGDPLPQRPGPGNRRVGRHAAGAMLQCNMMLALQHHPAYKTHGSAPASPVSAFLDVSSLNSAAPHGAAFFLRSREGARRDTILQVSAAGVNAEQNCRGWVSDVVVRTPDSILTCLRLAGGRRGGAGFGLGRRLPAARLDLAAAQVGPERGGKARLALGF